MRKRLLWLPTALLILALPAAMVWADEPIPGSNTLVQTGYVFREPQDQYLSPVYYTELSRPVALLQFDMPDSGSNQFRVGLGLPINSLYFGAYYGGANYIIPLVSGSGGTDATAQTKETSYTLDPLTGEIILTTVTTTKEEYWMKAIENDARLLFGIKLGSLSLGVYNRFYMDDGSSYGTYDPGFTLATDATFDAPWVAQDDDTASVVTRDSAGTVLSQSIDEFATGEHLDTTFEDTLNVGVSLPLGGFLLRGVVGLGFTRSVDAAFGAREIYATTAGAGYPSFTPTTALPDATAAAIADASSYDYREGTYGQSTTELAPSFQASIDLPFALPLGKKSPAVLTAGLEASWTATLHGNSYTDLAGAEQTASGNTSSFYQTVYDVGTIVNPGEVPTTRTTTRAFASTVYTKDFSHSYSPGVQLVVTPSESFRFGIWYMPTVTFTNQAYTSTGGAVSVVTYEDGDGTDGNATATVDDPDDYVSTSTVTRGQTSYTSSRLTLGHAVGTGAQFFLIPKRLRVNLGGYLTSVMVNRWIVTQTAQGVTEYTKVTSWDGQTAVTDEHVLDTTPDQQTDVYNTGGSMSISYEGGLTFFFSEDMFLDLLYEGNAGTDDIWRTDNWSLELTILL